MKQIEFRQHIAIRISLYVALFLLGGGCLYAQNITVMCGSSFTIASQDNGEDVVSYRWLRNGAAVAGSAASYSSSSLTSGVYTFMRLASTAECVDVASNEVVVTVLGPAAAPVVSVPVACVGQNVVFTVPRYPGVTYSWASTGGVANANSYTFATVEQGTTLSVSVTSGTGACASPAGTASVTPTNMPVITTQPQSAYVCAGAGTTLVVAATNAEAYQWKKNGADVGTGSASYSTGALTEPATYTVTVTGCKQTLESDKAGVTVGTAPGATVAFADFILCSAADVLTTWYLADTREANNPQTYTVRKLQDGHIWMVQDMKFGDQCNKPTFTGSSTVTGDQFAKITSLGGTWYGDCMNGSNAATPSNRGYLYDWSAAMQKAGALYGSSTNVGCSGTASGSSGSAPGACQGLCPAGWHIPTGAAGGEYITLHDAIGGCVTTNNNCWNAASSWEGVLGGLSGDSGPAVSQGSYAYYWSSTYFSNLHAYYLTYNIVEVYPGTNYYSKSYGRSVRCVRNY